MKIEIDLAEFGFTYDRDGDPVRVRDLDQAVVVEAAKQLIGGSDYEFRRKIMEQVESASQEYVRTKVEQVLAEPIQKRQQWGDPIGEPVSIREIARTKLEEFLKAPANHDRHRVDRSPSNLTDLVQVVVTSMIKNELAEDIRTVRRDVADKVQKQVLKAAAEALAPKP